MFRAFLFSLCFFSSVLSGESVRILSFDGGGVRGVVTLEFLRQLREEIGTDFYEDCDIYVGTSTGSIIALGLACGMSIDEMLEKYRDISLEVFSDGRFFSFFTSEYSAEKLKIGIEETLESCGFNKDTLVKDLPKKIIITAVNLNDESIGRWRMDFIENLTPEGGDVKVVDAILRSTAAPTYFPSQQGYIDGGMGMNDPSLAGLMFAYQQTDDIKNLTLLSLGTGYEPRLIEGNTDWGEAQWVFTGSDDSGYVPLLNLLMDVDSQIPEQVVSQLLKDRYKKVNFALPDAIALDDYEKIDDLIEYTKEFIRNNRRIWNEITVWVDNNLIEHG